MFEIQMKRVYNIIYLHKQSHQQIEFSLQLNSLPAVPEVLRNTEVDSNWIILFRVLRKVLNLHLTTIWGIFLYFFFFFKYRHDTFAHHFSLSLNTVSPFCIFLFLPDPIQQGNRPQKSQTWNFCVMGKWSQNSCNTFVYLAQKFLQQNDIKVLCFFFFFFQQFIFLNKNAVD